jgi:hypothetical protein
LEKIFGIFPMNGKNVSNGWKILEPAGGQGLGGKRWQAVGGDGGHGGKSFLVRRREA